MKFFAVLALIVAVAQAGRLLPGSIPAGVVSVDQQQSEIQEIIAAINHPSTDPATAAALEEMLFDILGVQPAPAPVDEYQPIQVGPAIVDGFEPIHVGPAIVEGYEPIHVGPAIVEGYEPIHVGPAVVEGYEPIHVGPAVVEGYEPIHVGPAIVDSVVESSPAAVPSESASAPLVQIILNINTAQSGAIVGSPVAIEGIPSEIIPSPVAVAEGEINPSPVAVVEGEINPSPVAVVEGEIVPTPVIVEELIPEPVIIGTPILPSPVAILPEELN